MARQKKTTYKKKSNDAALGFEATLWAMADKQRGHMDAAEYKHKYEAGRVKAEG